MLTTTKKTTNAPQTLAAVPEAQRSPRKRKPVVKLPGIFKRRTVHRLTKRLPLYRDAQASSAFDRQDCSRCKHALNCWASTIDDRLVATNLLVCRIQRGIRREQSTKLFLQMVEPKIKKLTTKMLKHSDTQREHVIADLQSMTIDRIMRTYRIGEIGYPLHYLFGPHGVIHWEAVNYDRKRKMVTKDGTAVKFVSYHKVDDERADVPEHDLTIDDRRTSTKMDSALAVIDDGLTLTALEYCVVKFALNHAEDQSTTRPLAGLWTKLSRRLGITRAKIERIYKDATQKLVRRTNDITY